MEESLGEFLWRHPPEGEMNLVSWHSPATDVATLVLAPEIEWWAEDRPTDAKKRLAIHFRGIRESQVRFGPRNRYGFLEAEDLEVRADDPLLWAHGPWATIFGNAPLPDPARFFVEFCDMLSRELWTGRDPSWYFRGQSFQEWRKLVGSSTTYRLLDGPVKVMEACMPLLRAQGADSRLLRSSNREAQGLHVVTLRESWVVCAESTAEILLAKG